VRILNVLGCITLTCKVRCVCIAPVLQRSHLRPRHLLREPRVLPACWLVQRSASRSRYRPGRGQRDHRACAAARSRSGPHAALADNQAAPRPWRLLLDPLVRLCVIDENHVGEEAELLAYFRSLQRQLDLSVLLVHHTRKNAAGGPPRVKDCAAPVTSMLSATRPCICAEPGNTGRRRRRRRSIWSWSRPKRRRPTWRSFRSFRTVRPSSSRTVSDVVSKTKCSTICPREWRSREPSFATCWPSRMSAWVRRWARSSEPASFAARLLAGSVRTDHPVGVVPVPHREKGNGTVLEVRARPSRGQEYTCQAPTSTELARRSRSEHREAAPSHYPKWLSLAPPASALASPSTDRAMRGRRREGRSLLSSRS
jgi:hypothetical protein